eukprot:scaffold23599_cov181-Cylindrotheca_fusiformis.AAC.1
MEGEDPFFAAPPPADAPPNEELGSVDQGFALVGEGEQPADDMGFAGGGGDMDAFAAPPAAESDDFASPPAGEEEGDSPIILGGDPNAGTEDVAPEEPPAPAEPVQPSAMRKWNEEWQVTLNERMQEEEAKKAEMQEAARLTLEKFAKDREAKREAKMAKNREDEQAKLEAIEADLENDNSWQKATKMVELTHDGAEDGADVKRMRDVMILLKNEPSRAEAVGA